MTRLAPSLALYAVSVLMSVPLAVGAFAVLDLVRFRRGAFGLYARATGLLAAGIAVGLAYYAVVVVSFGLDGALAEMAAWPLTARAGLLYLQAALVTGAVLLLRAGGQRMAEITHPGSS